jgi:hypothetical protein
MNAISNKINSFPGQQNTLQKNESAVIKSNVKSLRQEIISSRKSKGCQPDKKHASLASLKN